MWTRPELKSRAKDSLKKYYWMAFLACIITSFLGGGGGGGIALESANSRDLSEGQFHLPTEMITGIFLISSMILLVVLIIAILYKLFVGNVVIVGQCRYFMESRLYQNSAKLEKLFFGFQRATYLNVVKIMFLRDLYNILWYLLLVIPGIVKTYEYLMIPYILSENPDMEAREVFHLSKEMMYHNKWNTFVLRLSFLGWYVLGALLCGIGVMFVVPYYKATEAELYAVLRSSNSYPLHGFGEAELVIDAEAYHEVL